jgi:hypothetical protein
MKGFYTMFTSSNPKNKKNNFNDNDDRDFGNEDEPKGNYVDENGKVWESHADFIAYKRKLQRQQKNQRNSFES